MAGDAHIDLNADVGEGFGAWAMGPDADLLALVTSVNIACGFHGGDPSVMDRTVAAAARAGIALGAHPGYFDLRGFGRRPMAVPPAEVETDVLYQVGALMAFADTVGAVGTVANLPPGARTTTIESKTNFMGAARVDTRIVAEPVPLHRGRTTQVWQTTIRSEDGKLVAVVAQTQMVLPAR